MRRVFQVKGKIKRKKNDVNDLVLDRCGNRDPNQLSKCYLGCHWSRDFNNIYIHIHHMRKYDSLMKAALKAMNYVNIDQQNLTVIHGIDRHGGSIGMHGLDKRYIFPRNTDYSFFTAENFRTSRVDRS